MELSVEHLSVSLSNQQILHDISLQVLLDLMVQVKLLF